MARIQDLLDGELIIEELQAADKAAVVREFSQLLARAGKVRDAGALERAILERESQGSTGIGGGIAIPHARSREVPEMVVAFGRSTAGIDFESLDGMPVHLVFLLVTPEDRPGDHLKTLARISRIMRGAGVRDELRRCMVRQEMQKIIIDEDSRYPNGR